MARLAWAVVACLVQVSAGGNESAANESVRMTNHIFIKVHKCASTTSSGVARRIANHDGLLGVRDRQGSKSKEEPRVWADHVEWHNLEGRHDVRTLQLPIFPLWAMIRHPIDRALSSFYHFVVEMAGNEPTLERMLNAYRGDSHSENMEDNHMFKYLRPNHCGWTDVECVLDAYDFIGVVEHYDESMVRLSEIVDTPLSSVLYHSSKVSSQRGGASVNRGLEAQPEEVQEYFKSEHWLNRSALDYELWHAVTRRVLEAAESDEFQRRLAEYRGMLDVVYMHCTNASKKEHACYTHDMGCYYPCMDALFGV